MNAFDVDYWIEVLHRRTRTLDTKSRAALLQLFELTEQLAPMGRDNRREFWLKAKLGSLEEFRDYAEEDLSEQEALAWMQSEYPDEECWYKFVSIHHNGSRKGKFYGLFLNGKCVLTLNDPNEDGNPFVATEFIEWLIAETKEVLEKLRTGTYNAEIQKTLPDHYKYGVISRRDYWDIYPEERADYRSAFSEEQIISFLSCKNEFEAEAPPRCIPEMTARKFYEACAVCYRAIEMERRNYFPFKDTKQEHLHYNGTTPKELYYMFADGRDDGLRNVPLDDAAAFADWKNKRGPHYEFNGSHPWEIVPSGSTEYSLHLHVFHSETGYYFSLSGSTFHRSKDTIRSFLALRDADFQLSCTKEPECLHGWKKQTGSASCRRADRPIMYIKLCSTIFWMPCICPMGISWNRLQQKQSGGRRQNADYSKGKPNENGKCNNGLYFYAYKNDFLEWKFINGRK